MSRKIARITQDKKLLLANEVVEDSTKIRLDSDGRLDTDEIIEYPAELEGGRNLFLQTNYSHHSNVGYSPEWTSAVIKVEPNTEYTISYTVTQSNRFGVYQGDLTDGLLSPLKNQSTVFPHMPTIIGDRIIKTIITGEIGEYIAIYLSNQAGDIKEPDLKVEKGSTATPWTPAPEDLGLNYPDSIQNFNSSISGNNIITPEFIEGYPFVKPVIDDSLVLWLDGSTGNNYEKTNIWKDLSGNGNDGQLMNFDFTEDSGWGDGGLNFDGVDDYVYCGNGESLNITDDLTIEMLVYVPEDGKFGGVVKGSLGFWAGNSYGLREYYGDCRFYITDGNNSPQINIAIPKEELVHIVGTTSKASNIMKGYRNGVLVSSGKRQIEDIQVQQNGLYVGMAYTTSLTKGNIFLVRIYNRALTDEEIMQNYQAGQCSPLLAMRGD